MLKLDGKLATDVLRDDYTGVLSAEVFRIHKAMETCKLEDLKHLQGRISVINDMIVLKTKASAELIRLKKR